MRKCIDCKQVKELRAFYRKGASYFSNYQDCCRARARSRYALKKPEITAKNQAIREQRLAMRTMEVGA